MAVALAQRARCVLYYNTILPKGSLRRRPLLDTPGLNGAPGIACPPKPRRRRKPERAIATSGPLHRQPALPKRSSRLRAGRSRERSCSPDTPMTRLRQGYGGANPGAIAASPCTPIAQPCAGWMRANLIAVGLRPAYAESYGGGNPGRCQLSPDPIEHPHPDRDRSLCKSPQNLRRLRISSIVLAFLLKNEIGRASCRERV